VDTELEIRLATTDDMDEVMRLAIMACEDNSFLDFSPALLAKEIWPALNMDHGLFAVIGPKDTSRIEGFVLLRIGLMFYSERPCLEEKCLWVHPEYRAARGGRARKLLEFTKKTADTLGLPLIIGILSTKQQDAKCRLYERVFGRQAGAFFLYGTQCGIHKNYEVTQ
jgi:N-acetylglutamate synthase-like GNAT family acetyltransferase